MTSEEQYEEYEKDRERSEIVKTKIHYSWAELNEMSEPDKISAMLQMKQDETMMWQRKSSQLYYYITVISLVLGAIIGFFYFVNLNK